jgi:peptidoglycan/LPS O-acetylase OafA/YrhL
MASGVLSQPVPGPVGRAGHRPRRTRESLVFTRRPALDGLRAVAALLVVLFHTDVPFVPGGYVGVDVFFVLSGFLITSLLVRELITAHRLDLIRFYARRVRRLLPAALLVLLVTSVIFDRLATPLQVALDRGGFVAAAAYVSNWYFLSQAQDYFAADQQPSPVMHYWSLSVEEQFYLVWPLLLVVLVLLARYGTRRLLVVISTIAAAGVVYAGVISVSHPMVSYFGTLARAYQLLLGGVIAVWAARRELHGSAADPDPPRRWPRWLAAAGLALVLLVSTPVAGTASPFARGLLGCVGTAAVIVGFELTPAGMLFRGLCRSVPQRLGQYSYAMYLWHWPVIVLAALAGVLPGNWPVRTVAVLAVTIALSAATWRWVEQPMQSLRLSDLKIRRRLALLGPAAAVAATALLLFTLPVSGRTRMLMAAAGIGVDEQGAMGVVTSQVQTTTGSSVLLIGDSHARFWVDPLVAAADARGWRLTVIYVNKCPWPRVTELPAGEQYTCDDQLRDRAIALAAQLHPDVVLLTSRSAMNRAVRAPQGWASPDTKPWLQQIRLGSQKFLDQLAPYTRKIVIVDPTPETATPMIDCLSTGVDARQCDQAAVFQPGTASVEAVWRGIADARDDVSLVNLDSLVCPGGVCPSEIDGVVTFKDTNHLTDAFARTIVAPFLARLAAVGARIHGG